MIGGERRQAEEGHQGMRNQARDRGHLPTIRMLLPFLRASQLHLSHSPSSIVVIVQSTVDSCRMITPLHGLPDVPEASISSYPHVTSVASLEIDFAGPDPAALSPQHLRRSQASSSHEDPTRCLPLPMEWTTS